MKRTAYMLIRAATVGLLLLTVLLCWRFNLFHPTLWFLRAAAFLVLFSALVWQLCLHIGDRRLRGAVGALAGLVLALYTGARLVSFYYQGESFNEEFLFHFNLQTMTFGLETFPQLAVLIVLYLLLAGVGGYLSVQDGEPLVSRKRLLVLPAVVLVLVLDPDVVDMTRYKLRNAMPRNPVTLATIDFEAMDLNPDALYTITDGIAPGKNLVLIYLESMEQMYTDESLFPGLTPFINSLSGEALAFDNIHQTRGTGFTVAGILASQCGTPLLFSGGPGGLTGNDILKNNFMENGFCLGDILDVAGYDQVFMGGASSRFGGKGAFLAAHGYGEILGKEQMESSLQDPAYLSDWGLYDDSLLERAAEKFDQLAAASAETERPFNLTVLTVDPHPPEGTPSRSCTPYAAIDNSIFHAIHCTDQLLENFITHLKRSPAWDDTVVFIMGDHLHMRNAGMDFYPDDYQRRLFVNVLNAGRTGSVDTWGSHMDMAPTLLGLMGVRHQQGFLAGQDLLAPDVRSRGFDDGDGERVAAIRYINMNLLSRIETGLCEKTPLYRINGRNIQVAGRTVDIRRRGRYLPMEAIGDTDVIMSLVDWESKVGLTFPVYRDSLGYEIYTQRNSNVLVLAPWASVREVQPELAEFSGLGLLFGNLTTGLDLLQADLDPVAGFTVQAGDCGDLLAKAATLAPQDIDLPLDAFCPELPAGNAWDEDAGTITLENVVYGALRYRATLTRNARDWYIASDLVEVDRQAPPSQCNAYFGNLEVLIPGIATADGPASMILNKLPEGPLTFGIGTVTPIDNAR